MQKHHNVDHSSQIPVIMRRLQLCLQLFYLPTDKGTEKTTPKEVTPVATQTSAGVIVTNDKVDGNSSDLMVKGSRSSTTSSLQSLENNTCSLTDVDNMPIMTVTDVEKAISGEAQTLPEESFVHLSNDAAAIMASTPELQVNPNVSSSPVDVVRRSGSRQAERPISLDLETLPEGVSAHSLFAELSVQEPDIIGQVDTGADITAMVGELDTVLKENKELLQVK